jgi:hypothetical protein
MASGSSSHPRSARQSKVSSGGARAFAVIVFVATMLLQPKQIHAQAHEFLGDWQQLTSDAGACARCQIVFSGGSSQLSVSANNGWSAAVEVRETLTGTVASGRGSWGARAGAYSLKSFSVDFTLRGERLYMMMTNELGDGRKRIVRGVFGRPWLGA